MLIFFFFRKCQVYVMPLLSENIRKRVWKGIFQSTCEKVWAWRYGNKTVDLPPVFQQSSRCLVTLPSRSRHALVTLVRQKLGIFLLILHTFGMVRHAPVTVSSRSLGAAGCPNFPEHIDQCHTKETQCSRFKMFLFFHRHRKEHTFTFSVLAPWVDHSKRVCMIQQGHKHANSVSTLLCINYFPLSTIHQTM